MTRTGAMSTIATAITLAFALSHCAQSVGLGSQQGLDAGRSFDALSNADTVSDLSSKRSDRIDNSTRDEASAPADVARIRDTRSEDATHPCTRDTGMEGDPDASVVCNDLVNDAPLVSATSSSDPLPVGRGGAIVPGLYQLVSLIDYGTHRGRPGRHTIMLSATDVSQSVHTSGDGTILRTSTIECVSGNRLFETGFCPWHWTREWTFDATPDSVVFYGPVGSSIMGNGSADVGAYRYQRVQ